MSEGTGPQSFAHVLTQIRGGEFNGDASEELAKLVGVVEEVAQAQGKAKGRMVVTLELSADDRGVVDVTAKITVTEPKKQRGKAVFWIGKGGKLETKDPRQTELPLRDVNAGRKAPKDATDAKEENHG